MKVCICGGTNPATNPKWYGAAQELGKQLVKNDFEMVWGGNAFGVLSHIHKEYLEKRKANTLIIPEVYAGDLEHMQTDKVLRTNQVTERTTQMFRMSNAVVVVPGGIGTIYEFWAAVEYKRAQEFDIDIILLNYKNFFKHQIRHFNFINKNGFTKIGMGGCPYIVEPTELFNVVQTPEQVIELLAKLKEKREKEEAQKQAQKEKEEAENKTQKPKQKPQPKPQTQSKSKSKKV